MPDNGQILKCLLGNEITLQNSQVYGMLSVNGYTGQVWYHTWHGDFIGLPALDKSAILV